MALQDVFGSEHAAHNTDTCIARLALSCVAFGPRLAFDPRLAPSFRCIGMGEGPVASRPLVDKIIHKIEIDIAHDSPPIHIGQLSFQIQAALGHDNVVLNSTMRNLHAVPPDNSTEVIIVIKRPRPAPDQPLGPAPKKPKWAAGVLANPIDRSDGSQ